MAQDTEVRARACGVVELGNLGSREDSERVWTEGPGPRAEEQWLGSDQAALDQLAEG